MSQITPSSGFVEDDQILGEFLGKYEAADDPEAVLRDYSRRHPRLAGTMREMANLGEMSWPADGPELPASMPERLGEFRILRLVAVGGMGEVYEAEQTTLANRRVAVKVLSRSRLRSGHARERFIREQRVLARLHQTNIVPVYTAGEDAGLQYLAMPFLNGAPANLIVSEAYRTTTGGLGRTPELRELACHVVERRSQPRTGVSPQPITDQGGSTRSLRPETIPDPGFRWAMPVPRDERVTLSDDYFRSVAGLMAEIADAIHHAHCQGVLHRDIKPSNIMVSREGQGWVIDFGVAWMTDDLEPGDGTGTDGNSTRAGTTGGGTVPYMSPEQIRARDRADEPVTALSDVWGLGVTLYELCTLRRAYDGPPTEVARRIMSDSPESMRRLVPTVPKDLEALCQKAMRREPGQRYQSAREFAEDLRRWSRCEPTVARGGLWWRRHWHWVRRNRAWVLAASAVLLVALAASLIVWNQRLEDRIESQQRESIRQRLHATATGPYADGWFDEMEELTREGVRLGGSSELRDMMFLGLRGVEGRRVKTLTIAAGSLAFDATGKRLIMGPLSGSNVRIWEKESDTVREVATSGWGPVAIRADGVPVQLSAMDGRLGLFDLDSGKVIGELFFPEIDQPECQSPPRLTAMTLSQDASVAAAALQFGAESGAVTLWDSKTGQVIATVDGSVTCCEFTPNGELLGVGRPDGSIDVFRVTGGKRIATLSNRHLTPRALAFARDHRRYMEPPEGDGHGWLLAVGDMTGRVTLWDVGRRVQRSVCRGALHSISSLAFSSDGMTLASCGRGSAYLWDVATGRSLIRLRAGNTLTDVAFSPDGNQIAVGSVPYGTAPAEVRVFQLEHGRGVATLRGLDGPVEQFVYSSDGRWMAALSHSWEVAVWDVRERRLHHLFQIPPGDFADNAAMRFDETAGRLAVAAKRAVTLWDVTTGRLLDHWELPPGLVDQLGFVDGGLISFRTETQAGEVSPYSHADWKKHPRVCRIRKLTEGAQIELINTIEHFNMHIYSTAATHDASHFVVVGVHVSPDAVPEQSARVYDGQGRELWSELTEAFDAGRSLSFSPDESIMTMEVPGPEGVPNQCLVEFPTMKPYAETDQVLGAFSPQTRYGLVDQKRNWVLARYHEGVFEPLVTFPEEKQLVFCRFSPDHRHVAWVNVDGSVDILDVPEIQHRLNSLGVGW